MVALRETFDSSQVEPAGEMGVIAPGEYTAAIIDSEFKDTKKNDGRFLSLTYKIEGGPEDGRQLWHNLNLENPNEKAMEIAYRELSAICGAVGKVQVSDTEELHGIPHKIKVEVETFTKNDGSQGKSNRIKKFSGMNGRPSGAANGGGGGGTSSRGPWSKSA